MPLASAHRPQASGDGGQAGGPAVRGERVEERVGRRVVALPGAAEGTRGRGEQHEAAGPGPGSARAGARRRPPSGRSTVVEPLRGERADHAVVEHAGGVHHRGQRVPAGRRRAGRERVPVGDVAGGDGDLGAQRAAVGAPARPRRRARARRLVSSRCRTPCSVDQVPGDQPPRAPVPPVISTVPSGFQRRGHGQHDLADVAGLADEPERLGAWRTSQAVTGSGRSAPREQARAARRASPGSGRGPPRSGRTPGSGRPGRRRRPRPGRGVGLAHLQEPAAARQQPQRGVDELAGQRVQHHVDAAAAGGGEERVLEVEGRGRRRSRSSARPRSAQRRPTCRGWRCRRPRRRRCGRAARRPCRRRRPRRAPAATRRPATPARSPQPVVGGEEHDRHGRRPARRTSRRGSARATGGIGDREAGRTRR